MTGVSAPDINGLLIEYERDQRMYRCWCHVRGERLLRVRTQPRFVYFNRPVIPDKRCVLEIIFQLARTNKVRPSKTKQSNHDKEGQYGARTNNLRSPGRRVSVEQMDSPVFGSRSWVLEDAVGVAQNLAPCDSWW